MRYMVITDTHFGHYKLSDSGLRHEDADNIIFDNCKQDIGQGDIVIHLGDVCIGDEARWNDFFNLDIPGIHWLTKGNHDKRSDSWYLMHGWQFVAYSITIKRFGYKILLSHTPQPDNDSFDINIHGHFHNTDHRMNDPIHHARLCKKHHLVKLEHEYRPYTLKSLIREWEKKKNEK